MLLDYMLPTTAPTRPSFESVLKTPDKAASISSRHPPGGYADTRNNAHDCDG